MARPPQAGTLIDGVPYQERRERFCGHFVESNGNRMQAFRLAFVVDPEMTNSEVFRRANELLADPEVIERVNEMRETAAAATLTSITQLMQDWADIANADPNELISYIRVCCRFCHGVEHRYQWGTEGEYIAALSAAARDGGTVPDIGGGFGYNGYRAPAATCPACYGKGNGQAYIHDTRTLVGPARKLYAGVRETRNGIEVLMHDQNRARENLARCFGAFKDAVAQTAAQSKAVPVPTPEMARDVYMAVIKGGKS